MDMCRWRTMYNYLAGLVAIGARIYNNKLMLRHRDKGYLENICREARIALKAECIIQEEKNTYKLVIKKKNLYQEIKTRLEKRKKTPIKSYIGAIIDTKAEITYKNNKPIITIKINQDTAKQLTKYLKKHKIPYTTQILKNKIKIKITNLKQLKPKIKTLNPKIKSHLPTKTPPRRSAPATPSPPIKGERELGLDTGLGERPGLYGYINLTEHQVQVILGTLLGDGKLDKPIKGNSRLQIRHSIKQLDYVEFKRKILSPISGELLFYKYKDVRTGKEYIQVGFNTKRSPYFTMLYKVFYKEGRKRIPKEVIMKLDERALAIFIGDDGTFDKSSKTIKISVDGYSHKDRRLIQMWLKERFNIRSTIQKDRIYILRDDYPKLVKLIIKYLPKSLHYKLGLS